MPFSDLGDGVSIVFRTKSKADGSKYDFTDSFKAAIASLPGATGDSDPKAIARGILDDGMHSDRTKCGWRFALNDPNDEWPCCVTTNSRSLARTRPEGQRTTYTDMPLEACCTLLLNMLRIIRVELACHQRDVDAFERLIQVLAHNGHTYPHEKYSCLLFNSEICFERNPNGFDSVEIGRLFLNGLPQTRRQIWNQVPPLATERP